jgi:hypothetical protein
VSDDRNEADRILGEGWMDPRHALLVKAFEAHPTRGLIVQLQQETDEHGEGRWSLCRQVEDDGWVDVWLRPWPLERFDERPPIKVGSWPEKEAELDPLADAQAVIDEHDDTPR